MTKTPKRAPTAAPLRYAVIVLGMHRSGTSALAGVLGHLGCDLPQSLMPPNENNPKGYFESNKVYQLNDALLASAGSSWDDWQEFNPGWFKSQRAEQLRTRARDVLAEEFGASPLFVLKDPRICRIAPFWLELLEQEGCRPLIICTHRNPLDVAASLERREGWPLAYGLLLWLRHVLDAEAGSRGQVRCFTSYERLMENWALVVQKVHERLDVTFPRQPANVAAEVEDFLTRELQHFRKDPENAIANPLLSEWIRESYRIFERWATDGERKADHAKLDHIRAALNQAAPAFGRLIQSALTANQKAAALAATQVKQSAEAQAEIDRLSAAQQTSDEALARARAALDEARHEADQAGIALQEQKAELETIRQRATADAADIARLTAELEAARHDHNQLRSALEQRSHEAEQVGIALREQTAELETTRQRATADAADIARLSAELEAARRAGERFEHDLKQSERSLFMLKTHLAKQMQAELANSLGTGGSRPLEEARKAITELKQQLETVARDRDAKQEAQNRLHEQALSQALSQEKDAATRMRAEYEQRIGELESARQTLLASTSWRITEPLRRIVRAVRRR